MKLKKVFFVILIILIMMLSNALAEVVNKKVEFSDLNKDHWSYDAVMDLAEKCYRLGYDVSEENTSVASTNDLGYKPIISGYEDGTFRPNQTITRAEVTKILCCYFINGVRFCC